MGDLDQPYSCTQWGNVAASGIPLITDDTGMPMFGLFHTENLLPSAVYIDHTMTVHYKQAGHDSEDSINDTHFILNNLYESIKKGEEIDEEKIKDIKSLLSLDINSNSQLNLFIQTKLEFR